MLKNEYRAQNKIVHRNVIRVHELFIDNQNAMVYSLMEYFQGKELFTHQEKIGNYNEEKAKFQFRQLLTGISHLHKNGIVHRDLKPNNLLLSKDGQLQKITDFNVAKFFDDEYKNYDTQIKNKFTMSTYTAVFIQISESQ